MIQHILFMVSTMKDVNNKCPPNCYWVAFNGKEVCKCAVAEKYLLNCFRCYMSHYISTMTLMFALCLLFNRLTSATVVVYNDRHVLYSTILDYSFFCWANKSTVIWLQLPSFLGSRVSNHYSSWSKAKIYQNLLFNEHIIIENTITICVWWNDSTVVQQQKHFNIFVVMKSFYS